LDIISAFCEFSIEASANTQKFGVALSQKKMVLLLLNLSEINQR